MIYKQMWLTWKEIKIKNISFYTLLININKSNLVDLGKVI